MQEIAASEETFRTTEETFRTTMDSASVGMILMELDERIVNVNTAACEFLGYAQEELIDCPISMLLHLDDIEELHSEVEMRIAGRAQTSQMEQRCIYRSGSDVWGLVTPSRARHADGSPRYIIIQVLDITERREMDRLKGEFISVVNHELRTPLSLIRGSLGLFLATLAPDFPEDDRELIEIAYKNCERLIHLINDILDIDKIAAGKMRFDFRTADLESLIE
ncbi:PAS domain S-box protein [Breoghania sp.]|uniref:PAS domain S-box protein n=1 Tax=Breoghania sp. TaxID=2065378 RepID=UPI002610B979|nr:PAS domain S-box protein [Breoghania sp.]MDJ0933313.1 PAS domain S-box protein [Breoghania sp.]